MLLDRMHRTSHAARAPWPRPADRDLSRSNPHESAHRRSTGDELRAARRPGAHAPAARAAAAMTAVWTTQDDVLCLELPYRDRLRIRRTVFDGRGGGPTVAIVAGVHGDELEGLYVCHRLARWLAQLVREQPDALRGRVELYPALNPLGLDVLDRAIPMYDVDLNRSFPGHRAGLLPQRIADGVMRSLAGAALVVDVHASNVFL